MIGLEPFPTLTLPSILLLCADPNFCWSYHLNVSVSFASLTISTISALVKISWSFSFFFFLLLGYFNNLLIGLPGYNFHPLQSATRIIFQKQKWWCLLAANPCCLLCPPNYRDKEASLKAAPINLPNLLISISPASDEVPTGQKV